MGLTKAELWEMVGVGTAGLKHLLCRMLLPLSLALHPHTGSQDQGNPHSSESSGHIPSWAILEPIAEGARRTWVWGCRQVQMAPCNLFLHLLSRPQPTGHTALLGALEPSPPPPFLAVS